MFTQKQREKIIRIAGMLDGLCWFIDDTGAEALTAIVEELEELLEEDFINGQKGV